MIDHMSGVVEADASISSVSRPPGSAHSVRRLDRTIVLAVSAAVFLGFVAFQTGVLGSWDARAMASVARNLWYHGSIRECCGAFSAFPADHSGYAKFGIGMSLIMAPLWGLDGAATPGNALYLTLAGPLLLAGSACAIARTGLVLSWRRTTVVITALAFAFATMAALYSTTLLSEPGVTFGASIALLGFVTWKVKDPRAGAWLLGGGVALAALFRPDSFVLIGIMIPGVLLFARPRELARTWLTWAPGLLTPLILAMAWTLTYNWLRFGSALDLGYGGPYDKKGFSTPLLNGVALQLFSPGKSFFLYSPILLVAIPGLVWLWRQHRAVAAVIIGLCVVRVCFYARWWTPPGGAGWGPRFLLPLCAVLTLPMGMAIEHVRDLPGTSRRLAIASFTLLGVISVGVQALAVSSEYTITEHAATNTRDIPRALVRQVVNERTNHLRWTWNGSPLRRAVIVAEHEPTPLHWFGDGRWPAGTALLLTAIVLAGLAFEGARRADRRSRVQYEHHRRNDWEPQLQE
jgi:hypothetical protein